MSTWYTCDYSPIDEERMKNKFFYYTKEDGISAKGKWQSGLFTGDVEFYHLRPLEKIHRVMTTIMIDGKIEGIARDDECYGKRGTSGYWLHDKKIGCHIRYKWYDEDRYKDPKITHYEIWKAGKLISTKKASKGLSWIRY